jgi:hypothetical protein
VVDGEELWVLGLVDGGGKGWACFGFEVEHYLLAVNPLPKGSIYAGMGKKTLCLGIGKKFSRLGVG